LLLRLDLLQRLVPVPVLGLQAPGHLVELTLARQTPLRGLALQGLEQPVRSELAHPPQRWPQLALELARPEGGLRRLAQPGLSWGEDWRRHRSLVKEADPQEGVGRLGHHLIEARSVRGSPHQQALDHPWGLPQQEVQLEAQAAPLPT